MNSNSIEQIRRKYPARIARAKAIKLYCKESCCAGDMESWKNCTFTACFLWKYRLGKEILGNTTSFKKHKGTMGISGQKEASQKQGMVSGQEEKL